jgi:quercetin dioxygenase-like cupin family protein
MTIATNATCACLLPTEGEHLRIFDEEAMIKIVGADTAGAYGLLTLSVAPGGGPPLHAHVGSETAYVISGTFAFTYRDVHGISTTLAEAGTVVHAPSGAAHRFENISATRSVLLLILSPEVIEYLRALAKLFPPGAQPDPTAMIAVSAAYHTEILLDVEGRRPEPTKPERHPL